MTKPRGRLGRPRRFPHVLCVGVTQEIMDGLERASRDNFGNLLSVSDSSRLALVNGLLMSGHIAPTTQPRQIPAQAPNGGGPYVEAR